jgi:hypothetical protein
VLEQMLRTLLFWEHNYISYGDPNTGVFTTQVGVYPEVQHLAWRLLFSDHMSVRGKNLTWQQFQLMPPSQWDEEKLVQQAYFLLNTLDSTHDHFFQLTPYTSESNVLGK